MFKKIDSTQGFVDELILPNLMEVWGHVWSRSSIVLDSEKLDLPHTQDASHYQKYYILVRYLPLACWVGGGISKPKISCSRVLTLATTADSWHSQESWWLCRGVQELLVLAQPLEPEHTFKKSDVQVFSAFRCEFSSNKNMLFGEYFDFTCFFHWISLVSHQAFLVFLRRNSFMFGRVVG